MVLHGTAMNKGEDTFFLALSKSVRRSYYLVSHLLVDHKVNKVDSLRRQRSARWSWLNVLPAPTMVGTWLLEEL
jgi:hypothetical protein